MKSVSRASGAFSNKIAAAGFSNEVAASTGSGRAAAQEEEASRRIVLKCCISHSGYSALVPVQTNRPAVPASELSI